jgi:hypothetical protein
MTASRKRYSAASEARGAEKVALPDVTLAPSAVKLRRDP